MSDQRALSVILAISVVTIGLRVVPFLALARLSRSTYLRYLGQKMPTGVMVLLVAYTVKDVDVTRYPYGLPDLGALALSVVLFWITRNSLIAIGVGLAVYLVAQNWLV